jgi:hypothetical protein
MLSAFDSGDGASSPLPPSTNSGQGGYISACSSDGPAPFSATLHCKRRECFLIRSTIRFFVVTLLVFLVEQSRRPLSPTPCRSELLKLRGVAVLREDGRGLDLGSGLRSYRFVLLCLSDHHRLMELGHHFELFAYLKPLSCILPWPAKKMLVRRGHQ